MRGMSRCLPCLVVIVSALVCPRDGFGQTPHDVAVIVNPKVPVDNLTVGELQRIILGDREFWPGGLRVMLVMQAPAAHERDVVLNLNRMSEAQFRQHWKAKLFRGETAVTPAVVSSARDAVDRVQRSPGSLAFVDAPTDDSRLKVVRIDGRLPGEPGYPLH
jgi:ABC-type phosphate transport system substrate-binding protein